MTWLGDLEAAARRALPDYVYGYYAMAAGDGQTHTEGIRDWATPRLRPRVLAGGFTPTTETTVLGQPIYTPLMVAPMAQLIAAHPDGEAAVGTAAAAVGSLLGVSMHTAVPFPQIQQTGAPWWFQVYVMRDRDRTADLVLRARDAGARALILTVDLPSLATRVLQYEPSSWPDRNLARRGSVLPAAPAEGGITDDALGPETIDWLHQLSGLPVVVKGVLRGDDARRCAEAGAAAVIVSTHGGRALDRSVTSASVLAEIAAALTGTGVEVYADSGLRSGTDVLVALALGARAVFVGRPALWGLSTAGSAGVEQVLTALTADLQVAMKFTGVRDVRAVPGDLLA